MSRTWIVGFDFSQHADHALAHAASLLEAVGGGRLIVVYVHELLGLRVGMSGFHHSPSFDHVEEALIADAQKTLVERVATVAARHPALEVTPRFEIGAPADVITSLARSEQAEQIVVGSHGRRGLNRLFLGSVAERVTRLSEVPVLVVKDAR